jgi:hypothetical protein
VEIKTKALKNHLKKKILENVGADEEYLKQRKEHLEKLGAKAINTIADLK